MSAVIGFPLMRFIDPNAGSGGSTYYRHLGCGDVIYSTSSTMPENQIDTCPLHGQQQIVFGSGGTPVEPGTSVRDPS